MGQAPSVGCGEPSLPGTVEHMQPQFISRFLEGQSGVTIKSVSCGDLFTTCMTGRSVFTSVGVCMYVYVCVCVWKGPLFNMVNIIARISLFGMCPNTQ